MGDNVKISKTKVALINDLHEELTKGVRLMDIVL